jgi:hypothetical protein
MVESALFRPVFDVPSYDFHEAKKLWTIAVLLFELNDRSLKSSWMGVNSYNCRYA